MSLRKMQLLNYLNNLYVPVSKTEEFQRLMKLVNENDYRQIKEDDAGKMFTNALVIETKGRGLYSSFQNFYISRIDVGKVTSTMVDIAIKKSDDSPFIPMKINRGNIKINLPE